MISWYKETEICDALITLGDSLSMEPESPGLKICCAHGVFSQVSSMPFQIWLDSMILQLDSMILKVFSNLNDSMILNSCSKAACPWMLTAKHTLEEGKQIQRRNILHLPPPQDSEHSVKPSYSQS